MQELFNPASVSYPKTFTGQLWLCIIRQWSPTTHVSVCEFNTILCLSTARLFWSHDWIVCTLTQITALSTTLLVMIFPFNNPKTQLRSTNLGTLSHWDDDNQDGHEFPQSPNSDEKEPARRRKMKRLTCWTWKLHTRQRKPNHNQQHWN